MNILSTLLLVVQSICALAMVGLILVQHGKGADMGAAFGSGGSGSLFGATGSANALSRATAVLATIFFVSTLVLTYMNSNRASAPSVSVLDKPALQMPALEPTPAKPAQAVQPIGASSAPSITK